MKTFKFIAALCGVAAFVCSCEKEDSKILLSAKS